MASRPSIDPAQWLSEQLVSASPDVVRALVKTFADALMGAEADAVCGTSYGERSAERVKSRNGYRAREWDTRAGTIELATPKLRTGSYFPDWLLERRRRGIALAADLPLCISGDRGACVGAAANGAGLLFGFGGFGVGGEIASRLFRAKAFSTGSGATAWDLFNSIFGDEGTVAPLRSC